MPEATDSSKQARAEERRRRLAEALRENLGRRKAQARARAAAGKPQLGRDREGNANT